MLSSPGYVIQKAVQKVNYNMGRIYKEAGLDIAYMQDSSRHRQLMPLYDSVPHVKDAWVAPNATLIGDVMVSKWATIWYNVTIRAEMNAVRVGNFSSIGDGTNIYTCHSLPAGLAPSVNIGKNVTIEAGCSIHSCIIDDDVVVGANTVIGAGCRIERGAQILPNSVVPPGRLIPAGQLWGGNSVEYIRDLTEKELTENYTASYSKGASEAATEFSLYPREFTQGDLAAGEETMEQYAEKKYFGNLKH